MVGHNVAQRQVYESFGGFSEVGDNKQLLLAIVVLSTFNSVFLKVHLISHHLHLINGL